MDHCPHCSQSLMYGQNYMLHIIRQVTGSHKRFCPNCGRKWMGRSRSYNNSGIFVFILLSGITLMFGFFQIIESFHGSFHKIQASVATGFYQQAVKNITDNPMAQEEIKKMGVDPSQALSKLKELRNNPAALAKLKKYKDNPAALAALRNMGGIGNIKKEMIEKAIQYADH